MFSVVRSVISGFIDFVLLIDDPMEFVSDGSAWSGIADIRALCPLRVQAICSNLCRGGRETLSGKCIDACTEWVPFSARRDVAETGCAGSSNGHAVLFLLPVWTCHA